MELEMKKEPMDYEKMLDELAMEHPELKKAAISLKEDFMDLMPEEMPQEEPELDLQEADDNEEELSLEL